jgi:NADH-quinone oxidoreductase subunit J
MLGFLPALLQTDMTPVATPFFFYMLAGIAVVSAICVITQKNPVHSAISLIFTLLSVAGLFLMLYAPFIAGVQIILYVGGIMVLFLFVIMLVNIERVMKEEEFNKQWLVALLVVACLGGVIAFVYRHGASLLPTATVPLPEAQNTQEVGAVLYGSYMLPFEIASILLLVAIVGAVVMAKKRI